MSASTNSVSGQIQIHCMLKILHVLECDKWPSEKPPNFEEIEIDCFYCRFKVNVPEIKIKKRLLLLSWQHSPKWAS